MKIDFIKVGNNHLIDPTITRMTTLQKYLQNLCNRREISKVEFDQMRPKNAKPASKGPWAAKDA